MFSFFLCNYPNWRPADVCPEETSLAKQQDIFAIFQTCFTFFGCKQTCQTSSAFVSGVPSLLAPFSLARATTEEENQKMHQKRCSPLRGSHHVYPDPYAYQAGHSAHGSESNPTTRNFAFWCDWVIQLGFLQSSFLASLEGFGPAHANSSLSKPFTTQPASNSEGEPPRSCGLYGSLVPGKEYMTESQHDQAL